MGFLLAVVLGFIAVASGLQIAEEEYQYQFAKFQVAHNKSYSRADFHQRYQTFKTNYDLIVSHNAKGKSWTLAVNEYADLTWDEFRATKLGYAKRSAQIRNVVDLKGLFSVPDSIDWRTKNAVTPVKNQEQCGACWAFSTTGSVEGSVAIATGKLISLSEQQLVDCSSSAGNEGCNGGLMDDAFTWIIENGGICSESSYPYTAADGTCQTTCTSVSQISSYNDVTADDEDALKAAVALQPVSVAVEADQEGFQFYTSGIFDGTCGTTLDHGVLVVGYGSDSGTDYWIVKNSWGTSWGEEGYIRLIRTGGQTTGQCGIAMEPSYPIA